MWMAKILKYICATLVAINQSIYKFEKKHIVDNTYYFIIEEYNQESFAWYDLEDVYED